MSPAHDASPVPVADVERFRRDGFVVLRDVFDPAPLVREVAAAFADGFSGTGRGNVSPEAAITFRYLPMMAERTPTSMGLLHRFLGHAEQFVGGDVVPVRAKAIEYHGRSSWHRDSELAIASLGFACYLDPLTGATGSLRVVPGSHRTRGAAADGAADGGVPVETAPGDVIVFDERLLHASEGGDVRRAYAAAEAEESAARRRRAATRGETDMSDLQAIADRVDR